MTDQPIDHHADFMAALSKLSPSDTVPRSELDPDALAQVRSMVGEPIVFRDWEVTDHGVRMIESESLLIGVYE